MRPVAWRAMRSATRVTSLPTLEKRTRSAAGMISTELRRKLFVIGCLGGGDDAGSTPARTAALTRGVVVTQQGGAVREVEVDVAFAVEVVEVSALAAVGRRGGGRDRD